MQTGPAIAYLLPTGRCNLDCSGCYATLNHWGRHSKAGELNIDEYQSVVAELVAMGVRIFDISGGEPLLYPSLVALCETIRAHSGTRIWLVTNGTGVTATQLDALSRLVERLVVSIDAPEPVLHDRLRGSIGAFARSVAALRTARQLPFPEIGVNQLLCRANCESVGDMVRWCRRERIDRLSLLSYRDVSEHGVAPAMIPSLPSLRRAWTAVIDELIDDHPVYVDLVVPSFLFQEATMFRRGLPAALRSRVTMLFPNLRGQSAYRQTVVVKPLGTLTGDTAMVNFGFFDLGSVRSGVAQTWETGATAWRQRLAERETRLRQEAPCSTCTRWNVCRGGCPAAAFHQWGKAWGYDRSCDEFRAAGVFNGTAE